MYKVLLSPQYQRSFKRMLRHKDFKREKLEALVNLLEAGEALDIRYKDHELKGEYPGVRECHIQNDILLLYRREKGILILVLVDIGTHSYLFE